MAVSHRTVISFGLIAIPIAFYTATQTMTSILISFTRKITAGFATKKAASIAAKSRGHRKGL